MSSARLITSVQHQPSLRHFTMVLQQLLESQRFSIQGARFRVRNIVGLPPLRWTWDDVNFRGSMLLVLTSSILITDLFDLDDKRGYSDLAFSRPFWSMTTTISLPVLTDADGDGTPRLRGIVQFLMPIIIFLDTLFDENASSSGRGKGRSLAHDQLEIFGSIERSLSSVGVEGRPCLLRFICEMHQRPIGRNSILGEVFDVVFSPKPSLVDVLHDYSLASERGADGGDCAAAYSACPMSLLTLMKAGQEQQQYEQGLAGGQGGDRLAVTKVQADEIRIGDTGTAPASGPGQDDPFDDNSANYLSAGPPIWQ
ncbi:hypothetical protein FJT64_012193 [Amphibalanus amphitrite]|uniref:Uncharacterized protein n=3 Tax=Amphibalanus amphitrite TaxID=1232801 RepID=A0A6A4V784_AMPAM|nr:hypothetical protein FJT64_012193 [Amphibalanus amphitrite]